MKTQKSTLNISHNMGYNEVLQLGVMLEVVSTQAQTGGTLEQALAEQGYHQIGLVVGAEPMVSAAHMKCGKDRMWLRTYKATDQCFIVLNGQAYN